MEGQSKTRKSAGLIFKLAGKLGPLLALIVILLVFTVIDVFFISKGVSNMKFLTPGNFSQVIGQTVVIAIGAVGMTFIIVSAGIDLSVGSLVAFTGVTSAWAITGLLKMQCPEALAMLVGLSVGLMTGAAVGLINGAAINLGKLPPFIVTLGMMEIVRGAALQWTNGVPIYGLPDSFRALNNAGLTFPMMGQTIQIPYSLFFLIVVGVAGAFILRKTIFGMQVYAVGSNENTARLCGVNVERVKLFVYTIGGLTMGVAGILHASRLNSGQPSEAVGMELEVIAAVVIGGGSLMGGEGTVSGAIIGAFIIKFLRNGCNIVGVSPYIQRIVIGLIIIIAVYIDQLRRRSASASKG
ncbi:MAG: ribose ABC transporter permease [bacterium]|nr:ribose ABC transporter permease [bacterium]